MVTTADDLTNYFTALMAKAEDAHQSMITAGRKRDYPEANRLKAARDE